MRVGDGRFVRNVKPAIINRQVHPGIAVFLAQFPFAFAFRIEIYKYVRGFWGGRQITF